MVELIVLNVGLQAGILSQRVFTIFVVMALVTTFLTTPIVTFLYYSKDIADLVILLPINVNSNYGVEARSIGTAIPYKDQMKVHQMKNLH